MVAESSAWVIIPRLDEDKTGVVLDMRPLVQCKHCQYGKTINVMGQERVACVRDKKTRLPDWFCADGEEKSEMKLKEAWFRV